MGVKYACGHALKVTSGHMIYF